MSLTLTNYSSRREEEENSSRSAQRKRPGALQLRGAVQIMRLYKLKTVIVPILVVGALTLGAPRAEAVLVAPGSTVPAAGIPFPGGTELDSVYYANQASANLVASIGSAVYDNGGFLDFYYQVSNNSPSNLIHRLTGSSFVDPSLPPFVTDVWFVINGATVPCSACPAGFFATGTQDPLTFDRDDIGEVVGFNFPTPGFEVDPGETSLLLLVQTNATVFQPGFVSVINSGSLTLDAFEPADPANIPEPASLLLVGIGLVGTAAARWRKRKG
jgi:hypothetical protein